MEAAPLAALEPLSEAGPGNARRARAVAKAGVTSPQSAPRRPLPPPQSWLRRDADGCRERDAVAAAGAMDRDFIARNQIVERYLSGRLPIKGATDFERFCKENPEHAR